MFAIDARISRAQRFLRMIEEDAPFLAHRLAELTPEHQQSSKDHVADITAQTRAEIARLLEERYPWDSDGTVPEPAD